MRGIRQAVEWPFGASGYGVKAEFRRLREKDTFRLQQVAVTKMFKCAVLMVNIRTCLVPESSQVWRRFNTPICYYRPPTLEVYLQ